jgi:hypothetical protein
MRQTLLALAALFLSLGHAAPLSQPFTRAVADGAAINLRSISNGDLQVRNPFDDGVTQTLDNMPPGGFIATGGAS